MEQMLRHRVERNNIELTLKSAPRARTNLNRHADEISVVLEPL
ncbi:hypothetical protein SAMN04488144_13223 [Methylobacterium sp. 190mf]|nr:hypothetical protein SAMN04488144_13223 [Methylobacterium sp. 190mf]